MSKALSTPLSILDNSFNDCWNRIGVHGDRSCPELDKVVHCHNCPVFAAAGRKFLNGPSPPGYLAEWTTRLAAPAEVLAADLESVLIFRIGEEWLALPVGVLAEITPWRQPHRIPHRGGLIAGLVNLRGELHMCVHLAQVIGVTPDRERELETVGPEKPGPARLSTERLLVTEWRQQRWVFPVDQVDQVHRYSQGELAPAPATVTRSLHRFSLGVFNWVGRAIGLLDAERLFPALKGHMR